jgi:pyrroloquinoline quinone (PQQ) biosynthesis protein C
MLPWFSRLSARSRGIFSSLGTVEEVAAGAQLLERGAVAHLCLIEAGEVEVEREGESGVRLGAGELVGEMAFLDNAPLRNNVTVVSAVRVRRIPRPEFMAAFAEDLAELKIVLEEVAKRREERLSNPPTLSATASAYVKGLAERSLTHRAVRHPYLNALASGTLPDTRWALADFARHYYGYASHFPRYLTTVISRLVDPAHRRSLIENLTEESGVYGEEEYAELSRLGIQREWIDGIPHPALFQRFSQALGVTQTERSESDQVVCWRDLFLNVLSEGSPAEALGALGIGTENIVRAIYMPFVKAIERLGSLRPEHTVFFPLHTAVDDHHQAALQAISADFAGSDEGRAGLRRGMLKALSLRSAFWDWLYQRALDPARAEEGVA